MSANALWKAAFWGCAVAVLVLSLGPTAPELPTTGWDKSNHFLGFFVLAGLGWQAHSSRRGWLFLGLLVFGGLIEWLQSMTSYRLGDWADWFADGLGVVAGFGLCWLLCRFGVALRGPGRDRHGK